jgi:hypothetical protein
MKKEELQALLGWDENSRMMGPIEDQLHALATEEQLPDIAVAICAVRMEEAGPPLRALLTRAADGESLSEDDALLLFRGLHLLGGAQDPLAWQPLLRLLHRPEDDLDYLLGDAITNGLAKIAAGVFDGDVDSLFGAITDDTVDEFIREALMGAATFLTWKDRIDRDRMQRFLEQFYQDKPAGEGDMIWIAWLEAIALLGLRTLAPLVHAAWDEGRVLEGILERHHFESDLADAERAPDDIQRFERANLGYIEDVLEALEWTIGTEKMDVPIERQISLAPVINPWRHVGRNDPCPCGSGKKAKKCCLGK